MDEDKIEIFRTRIKARINELKAKRPTHVMNASDIPLDDAEHASRESERYVTITLSEKKIKELSALEVVLKRIEEETFGICNRCGADISEARLEVNPHSVLCMPCQRIEEIREGIRKRKRQDASFYPQRDTQL